MNYECCREDECEVEDLCSSLLWVCKGGKYGGFCEDGLVVWLWCWRRRMRVGFFLEVGIVEDVLGVDSCEYCGVVVYGCDGGGEVGCWGCGYVVFVGCVYGLFGYVVGFKLMELFYVCIFNIKLWFVNIVYIICKRKFSIEVL